MKKVWRILLILLLLVCLIQLAVTLFGKPRTPQGILAAARHNLGEAGSMRFDMELDMDVSLMEKELDVQLSMQGEMTQQPSVAHGVLTMDMVGKELTEMEVYLEAAGDDTVAYIGMDAAGSTVWTKQNSAQGETAFLGTNAQNGTLELLELASILADTEPERVSETEMRYSGVIPADKIKFVLQTTGLVTQLLDIEISNEALLNELADDLEDLPITVIVNPEEPIISGYELNMTSVIHKILLLSMQQSMEKVGLGMFADSLLAVENVTIRMNFRDFDQVPVIDIPDEARNAIPAE